MFFEKLRQGQSKKSKTLNNDNWAEQWLLDNEKFEHEPQSKYYYIITKPKWKPIPPLLTPELRAGSYEEQE